MKNIALQNAQARFQAFKFLKLFVLSVLAMFFVAQGGLSLAETPNRPADFDADANGKFLLLEFYAPYCGTCQMMQPYVESLKAKTAGVVNFKQLDSSLPENQKYAKAFHVTGTPTYVLFNPSGQAVYKMDGMISPQLLEQNVLQQARPQSGLAFPVLNQA